jgi:peroxiredoxin
MTTELINVKAQRRWRLSMLRVLPQVLLLVSLVCNFGLGRKVNKLQHALSTIKAQETLAVGATVPPFEARDLKRNAVAVTYATTRTPTVLYVISPTCVWCARNEANIRLLVERVGTRFRFIALSESSEGLAHYAEQKAFPFPIYADMSPATLRSYKLGGTPQTLVISPDGKVLRNWSGAYTGALGKEVESFFGVKLPGWAPGRDGHPAVAGGGATGSTD